MANAITSRLGQVNEAGAVDALFLKQFGGEVLTSFEQNTVMKGKHQERQIRNGKTAQFPVMGRADAYYHTVGEEILGGKLKHAERLISIDQMLISPSFIAEIDELMNHYDVRSTYSSEQGRKLATVYDRHVLQVGVQAARSAAAIDDPDQFGGTVISGVTATNGDQLVEAMYAAAEAMDVKDVADGDRYMFVRPEQYYALVNSPKALNRDFGGEGSIAKGNIFEVAGIKIIKTNNLPSSLVANGTLEAGTDNKYAGDYSTTVGLVMHTSAIGTLKLLDLAMESKWQMERQGTLMLAKMAVGHGILRPESAVEITI